MINKLGAKFINQISLHELVVIWDLKTEYSLALNGLGKLSFQSIQVRLLHAKDDVGPSQMPFRDNDARVGLRAYGANLIMRRSFEQLFGRQTAQSVSAANEEQFFSRRRCHETWKSFEHWNAVPPTALLAILSEFAPSAG
jgi:hypothetical protein